jgi:hypothetical protein
MRKTYWATQDTYITNKIVKGTRRTSSNVGRAGTLDLYKLYNEISASMPVVEKTCVLIKFDTQGLRDAVDEGRIDHGDPSFWCKIRLRDVYGGQPTPSNFTVSIFPLSASFREGHGKDVVYLSDRDTCNWLSSSLGIPWYVSGCAGPCHSTGLGDYITASSLLTSTEVTQSFVTGEEDLVIDVTRIVSATLEGDIPDSGFRLTFTSSIELDSGTYFVKRFASKDAYDSYLRPRLEVGFDDSLRDMSVNPVLGTSNRLFMFNHVNGILTNLTTGSTTLTGSNCVALRLTTPISGGQYTYVVTGSQASYGSRGILFASGVYSASVNISEFDAVIRTKLVDSSSIDFTPVWTSLDGQSVFHTGSVVSFRRPDRSGEYGRERRTINFSNVREEYTSNEVALIRVDVFDDTSPNVQVVRIPTVRSGIVLNEMHYAVRDVAKGERVIDFDTNLGSTRMSSDSSGMYFELDTSCLISGRTYAFDVLIVEGLARRLRENVSPVFRVVI